MVCEDLLSRFTGAAREAFGGSLVGVYLHGSAAMGCFHPETSDLDLLLVAEGPVSDAAKLAFMERALELNELAPAKGLEFSVVRREVCRPFVYPAPFELHFSNAHLKACREDLPRYVARMRGVDKDLAAHFTVINACGVVLYGEAVSQVFAPVPRADYLDSILNDIGDACREITGNPVYYTLNLCRVLAQVREGLVLSKQSGGEWGLRHLPEEFHPVIQAALESYEAGQPMAQPNTNLLNFAAYILSEIKKNYEEETV
ncbi:MAG: DUF4111 domain-containing protein [Oscillospiraceae bacterium]|nr:DUF4111 domain-containing protein [Oscillospiraceae bacterium]